MTDIIYELFFIFLLIFFRSHSLRLKENNIINSIKIVGERERQIISVKSELFCIINPENGYYHLA